MQTRRFSIPPWSPREAATRYPEFMDNVRIAMPEQFNFARDVLDAVAVEDPHRPAMVHVDAHRVRRDLDVDYFRRSSSRVADGLIEAGVEPGDRVMLMLNRRLEFWSALLALHKIGAVAVPLPSMLTAHDITYRLGAANLRAAVVEDALTARVDEARVCHAGLRVLVKVEPGHASSAWQDFDALGRGADLEERWRERGVGGADPAILFFFLGHHR